MENQILQFRGELDEAKLYYQPSDEFDKTVKTRYEKMPADIFATAEKGAKWVAHEIANLIKEKAENNDPCVLGLATGATPLGVYSELVRLHKEEGMSFQNVITFNLDEYYPMDNKSAQSYNYYMDDVLFNHIDIPRDQINVPDGEVSKEGIFNYCSGYEAKIDSFGGLDMQILGIGRTGHIGFNEPGSQLDSKTRLIMLDALTRRDAAKDFNGLNKVPKAAITMGVGTIFKAKRVILMAWGEGKAPIVKKALEEGQCDSVPASYLQRHNDVQFVLDVPAANELTRVKQPWLVGSVEWDRYWIRKAVVWLCNKLEKPVLKLTNRDYNDNGLSELLAWYGSAYEVNIKVFNDLQHTITGWPGGKPNADDSNRPERAEPAQKKVLVFSPHPDDDVISMGGTLKRLVDQSHEVHVAYQTSGNIAVADDEAIRYLSFVKSFAQTHDTNEGNLPSVIEDIRKFLLENKSPGEMDTVEVRRMKSLIRRGEAKAACRFVGLRSKNLHFLDMPFYETGKVKKNPLKKEDVQIVVNLLRKVKPQQIFAAGDWSDPHGTHRVCWEGIYQALQIVKDEEWMENCYVWLYRGAWQEWDLDEIQMAVPISPEELQHKRNAILRHQSQMESAPYMGNDSRLFWQRSEDRNRATANLFNKLGLAEYEAIEAFVRFIV
ncbi:glucosamine-6-phosphate deaminase [Marinifilum flexuosum]|uniref:Glucosamine-6-phosphate deaminase n=1 Tax=Marinifilum flexuosum TaxID=1117708 RepID=A0A419WXA7_9BACT|nr:glucosamine-6-phosphate deaminase [Marinifilum flexuosum]RKE00029.1 glucosamine-6-phosphate deaminase [Marinifilum flexuosum]